MEIANNAITFWNFQKHQLCANLERKVEYYRETVSSLKRKMMQEKSEAEGKIHRLEQQLEQTRAKMIESNEDQSAARDKRGELSRKDHCEKKRRMDDFLFWVFLGSALVFHYIIRNMQNHKIDLFLSIHSHNIYCHSVPHFSDMGIKMYRKSWAINNVNEICGIQCFYINVGVIGVLVCLYIFNLEDCFSLGFHVPE